MQKFLSSARLSSVYRHSLASLFQPTAESCFTPLLQVIFLRSAAIDLRFPGCLSPRSFWLKDGDCCALPVKETTCPCSLHKPLNETRLLLPRNRPQGVNASWVAHCLDRKIGAAAAMHIFAGTTIYLAVFFFCFSFFVFVEF